VAVKTSEQPALAATAMRTALVFLTITAALGAALRGMTASVSIGLPYNHLLHAHSHVAFMGWIFNGFFALALVYFLPTARRPRNWHRLFFALQVGVVGMLFSFPFQGYGPVSIAFSTLHLAAAAVFACWLWRDNHASDAARPHLRIALLALVLSGLGPLALGPLAAMDLRDHPGYLLSIYYYLHTHYNGWFVFFLQATALQLAGPAVSAQPARRAAWWLGAGLVLTFAQSTLWLAPPLAIHLIAAAGGVAQLIGMVIFLRALAPLRQQLAPGWIRALVLAAVAAWVLKTTLQVLAAIPSLDGLVNHRFIVIAFLHLVFLGIATPALLATARQHQWLPGTRTSHVSLLLFFAAAVWTQLVLVALPLNLLPATFNAFPSLAIAAVLMLAATVGLAFTALRTPRAPTPH
jgi:hypothetical protein